MEENWAHTSLKYIERNYEYNKTIHLSRKAYFFNTVSENVGDSKILFSTIDQLQGRNYATAKQPVL